MNTKKLIAAVVVFAAAGAAFADVTGTFEDQTHFVSTRTRAEVVAELKQAQGQLARTEWVESGTLVAQSTRTRDEVRAEAIQTAKKQ